MEDFAIDELVREQFPTLGKMIYANHAAISPWPKATMEAVTNFAVENNTSGPLGVGQWLVRETRLRERIAQMLNAENTRDIALLKNTTEGINTVANGIEWQAGDNVVTTAEEFVSNQMAWDALEAGGVEIRRIPVLQAADPENDLASAIDRRTRVLAVSSVQWDSGFRLDLEKLGQECSSSPALFFVDAIQQFPVIPIDVQACRIDVLAASAHKWQMGPEGLAIFYCNELTREKLQLAQYGWRMLDNPYQFSRADRLPSTSSRRFEAGSPNTLGQAALFASLGLFCEVGIDQVERRIRANSGQVIIRLSDMKGITLTSRTEESRRSGIVSFEPGEHNPAVLTRKLARRNIYTAVRGTSIRLSPHFYQSPELIKEMMNTIEEELDKQD